MRWQIRSRLTDEPLVYAFTDKAKLMIRKGMTGATGNLYCGLHEFHDMGFLLHVLRKEDTFLDVGANVGSYTVLASAHIGAKSIAIEPVPETFAHLQNNVALNKMADKVTGYNMAVGSAKGQIAFTRTLDTTNRVAQAGDADTVTVPMDTLDAIVRQHKTPVLIKIDVEGYETEVIEGATETLQLEPIKAIIIELGGAGERYGFDERKIHKKLIRLKFVPYQYNAFTRELSTTISNPLTNTLYIRDLAFIQHRIQTAPRIQLPAMTI